MGLMERHSEEHGTVELTDVIFERGMD